MQLPAWKVEIRAPRDTQCRQRETVQRVVLAGATGDVCGAARAVQGRHAAPDHQQMTVRDRRAAQDRRTEQGRRAAEGRRAARRTAHARRATRHAVRDATFAIRNRAYRHLSGGTRHTQLERAFTQRQAYGEDQEPWHGLAALSPKGGTLPDWVAYLTEVGRNAARLNAHAQPMCHRRWDYETERSRQRALQVTANYVAGRYTDRAQWAAMLNASPHRLTRSRNRERRRRRRARRRDGDTRPTRVTVAWGDCFQQGHRRGNPPVPSKAFLPHVARIALVVLTDEFRTTAQSAAHSTGYDRLDEAQRDTHPKCTMRDVKRTVYECPCRKRWRGGKWRCPSGDDCPGKVEHTRFIGRLKRDPGNGAVVDRDAHASNGTRRILFHHALFDERPRGFQRPHRKSQTTN